MLLHFAIKSLNFYSIKIEREGKKSKKDLIN